MSYKLITFMSFLSFNDIYFQSLLILATHFLTQQTKKSDDISSFFYDHTALHVSFIFFFIKPKPALCPLQIVLH